MELCMIRMKRNTVITIIFLLLSLALSACAPAAPDDQTAEDPSAARNGAATEIPEYGNTDTPEFWGDIGKTLFEVKNEHPDGEFIVNLDGFPDSAAACFAHCGGVWREEKAGFSAWRCERTCRRRKTAPASPGRHARR